MRRVLFTLSSALILASCGSDGSGGSTGGTPAPSPTPSPSPSPTPTPTPTPTPVASYSTFDALAGDQNYPTGCASAQFPAGLPTVSPATNFGAGLQFTYTAATQVHALNGDGISLSFGPADHSALNSTANADVWIKGNDDLTLEALTWGGTRMVYNRVSYLDTSKAGTLVAYACITGVPTLDFDVPTSGTAAFPKAGMDAAAFSLNSGTVVNYALSKSIVTFQADFAAKKVTIAAHLIATTSGPPPHTDVDLGTVTGNGTIDAATGRFSGIWSSTDRDAQGNFAGSFFGPQAQEFGLTYSVDGKDGTGTRIFASYGAINGSR